MREQPTEQSSVAAIAARLRFATYGRSGRTANRRIGRNRHANATFDVLRATNDFGAATTAAVAVANFLAIRHRAAFDDGDIRGAADGVANRRTLGDTGGAARLSSATVACVGDVGESGDECENQYEDKAIHVAFSLYKSCTLP